MCLGKGEEWGGGYVDVSLVAAEIVCMQVSDSGAPSQICVS